MWDSRTCVFYFDTVLAQAFRQKRAELGEYNLKGAVIFDKALRRGVRPVVRSRIVGHGQHRLHLFMRVCVCVRMQHC